MTVKQFFKSTAFKSLAVLLSIVIIAGGLLAICNDLLYVSEEEKFERSLAKIYGGSAKVEETIKLTNDNKKQGEGKINYAYLMDDGNYLIQATGEGGFSGGTATVWVVVGCKDKKFDGVKKVVYETNEGQTYISKFGDAFYDQFVKSASQLDGKTFSTDKSDKTVQVVNAGASMTTTAMCNAVNAAVSFFKTAILGEEVVADIYAYQKFVDVENSTITPDIATKTVTYSLAMKKNGIAPAYTANVTVVDGVITAFAYEGSIATDDSFAGKVDASLKDGSLLIGKNADEIKALITEEGGNVSMKLPADASLTTGATYSSMNLILAAAFATANFDTFLYPVVYADWITEDTHTVEGTTVTYTLTVKKNAPAPAINVTVVVTDGAVASVTVGDKIADPDSFADSVAAGVKDGSFFVGKTATDMAAMVKEDGGKLAAADLTGLELTTGATRSTESIIYAVAYATCNYATFLAKDAPADNGGDQ